MKTASVRTPKERPINLLEHEAMAVRPKSNAGGLTMLFRPLPSARSRMPLIDPDPAKPETLEPLLRLCPHGKPGDRLWGRETWASLHHNGIRVVYRADGEDPRRGWDDVPPEKRPRMLWASSTQMPREHARVVFEVARVEIARLHDVTTKLARASGICVPVVPAKGHPGKVHLLINFGGGPKKFHACRYIDDIEKVDADAVYRAEFAAAWDNAFHKLAPWQGNPLVYKLRVRAQVKA
jgi:hypothetical protein